MKLAYKNREMFISAKRTSLFGKLRGLMFRKKETAPLLFEFSTLKKPSIHSLFVFFPFLAMWLDEKNQVLEYNVVRPFCLYSAPYHKAKKLLEVPFNKRNAKIIEFFVGKGKI